MGSLISQSFLHFLAIFHFTAFLAFSIFFSFCGLEAILVFFHLSTAQPYNRSVRKGRGGGSRRTSLFIQNVGGANHAHGAIIQTTLLPCMQMDAASRWYMLISICHVKSLLYCSVLYAVHLPLVPSSISVCQHGQASNAQML